MIPALIVLAATVDLMFCGFRAAAGRNARIFKLAYYRRALLAGAAVGVALSLLLGGATAALAARDATLFPALVAIGRRMLVVIAVYAALVLLALAVYQLGRHEVRTLASVAILGPFTLIRPAVVAGAALYGLAGGATVAAAAVTIASSAAVLASGALLDRAYARRD